MNRKLKVSSLSVHVYIRQKIFPGNSNDSELPVISFHARSTGHDYMRVVSVVQGRAENSILRLVGYQYS